MDYTHEDYDELLSDKNKVTTAIFEIRDHLRKSNLMKPFNLLVYAHSFAVFNHPDEFKDFLKEAHRIGPEDSKFAGQEE